MGLLEGQVAVVTGAGQGIGLAIAQAFAGNGAAVLVADIDEELAARAASTLTDTGVDAVWQRCDVTDPAEHEALVATCLKRFGSLDVLVNNAGITRDAYISKMPVEDFQAVIDVSLKGAWLGTRAVSPLMREQGHGAIVNVSSLSGKSGNPGQTNYSAAKAGLVGLTKAAAKELGPSGVRVNAVQPGLIRTPMTLSMRPEIYAAKEQEVPMRRAGLPEEVAGSVLFLASPLAGYVTGAVLEVTGGRGM